MMKKCVSHRYGSPGWFANEYSKVDDDPWGLGWRASQKVRYARMLSLLGAIDISPGSILDVGCAAGDFTHLLKAKYGQASSVIGVDFVGDAIQRARTKYPSTVFRLGSIFDVGRDYEGQVDLITCLEVLYYLDRKDCPLALSSLKASLRPGGYVVFSSLISKPPHFSPAELTELVSREFTIVRSETIHLKLLSISERIIMKVERLGKQKLGLAHQANFARSTLRLVPFWLASAVEKCSCVAGSSLGSHAIVLARR
jgi:2-polyprenyl-3-methyl-5-hydroxy-6-metoxy-1,4-benzoquinol methylase